ncbi:MAG: ABC transporter substrate-binding protein, partial [Bacillota bacterium]|nr:ABC transporter substrate-binding protein [Bacillota bacterium]
MRKVIGIIIVFTLILSGCIKDKKSTDTGRDNYIVCSLGELPASLNLSDLDSSRYAGIDSCVFEGLVTMDRKGNIEPGLAESWSVSSDGIGYKFNIRKDAKWSDGKAISAQDFVSFFESILSGRNAGYFAYDLSPVFGVSDYSKGRKSYDSVAIRSLDKNTLEIRLNKACPDFLKILSKPQYGLRKDKNLLDKWATAYGSIRYSGPFVIEGVDNKGAVLAKNPFYWNCSEITGEKFLLSESKSKEEALADFETGKTDLLLNPPISEIERIITGDSAVIVNSGNIISLVFNPLNKGITKDMALRKSIVSNIDTKNLKDSYLEEFQP